MNQRSATAAGFIAASVLPAVLLSVVDPISGQRDAQSVIGSFLVTYFFTASATLALGLPCFMMLRRVGAAGLWSAVFAGALVAVVALALVRFSISLEAITVLKFASLGAAAGFVFWLFWRSGQ